MDLETGRRLAQDPGAHPHRRGERPLQFEDHLRGVHPHHLEAGRRLHGIHAEEPGALPPTLAGEVHHRAEDPQRRVAEQGGGAPEPDLDLLRGLADDFQAGRDIPQFDGAGSQDLGLVLAADEVPEEDREPQREQHAPHLGGAGGGANRGGRHWATCGAGWRGGRAAASAGERARTNSASRSERPAVRTMRPRETTLT